jgi:phosphatidylglycerophosphate synthase
MRGNKVPDKYENFFDLLILNFIDTHIDKYKQLNFTPNKLTFMAFITGLITVYLIYKKQYKMAAFMFLLSYYYDIVDGKFARKYNMVTKLGDYLDHASDYIKTFLLFGILYYDNPKKFKRLIPLFLLFLSFVFFGALIQETLFNKDKSIMSIIVDFKFAKNFAINNISLLKYIGFGTGNLIMALIIFFWDRI